MPKLLSRQRFVPNGFRYYEPAIKWQAPKNVSFDQVVTGLIRARQANPGLAKIHKWPTDYATVADQVDEFNARVCEANGWTEYITSAGGYSIPKTMPHDPLKALQSLKNAAERAKELVRGAKTLLAFLDSGDKPVSPELAEHRAIICTQCPKNEAGDFTRWFTAPAAELIKRQVEKSQAMSLTTPRDAQLNLCTACHCPLKLKVHVPIQWIAKGLTEQQIVTLKNGKDCWIIAERERMGSVA
jgi:hypothetical protein